MGRYSTSEVFEAYTDSYLPPGSHLVEIEGYRYEKDSQAGNHQFSLTFKAKDGASGYGYYTVTERAFPKINGLARHTGVEFTDDEIEYLEENDQVPESFLKRVVGKKVGVVFREEEKYGEPGKMQNRFQGTCPIEKVGGRSGASDIPSGTPGSSTQHDDDIPF